MHHTPNHPAKPNLTTQICKLLFIGLVVLPINSLWVVDTGITGYGVNFTRVSLFMNAIFGIFVLILINPWLKRYVPRFERHGADLRDAVRLISHRGSRHDSAAVPAHRTRILLCLA